MTQTCKGCVYFKPDFDKNGRRYTRVGGVYECVYPVQDVAVPTSLLRNHTYKPLSQQRKLRMPPDGGAACPVYTPGRWEAGSDLDSGE